MGREINHPFFCCLKQYFSGFYQVNKKNEFEKKSVVTTHFPVEIPLSERKPLKNKVLKKRLKIYFLSQK